jgi:hypothetical protein
MPVTPGPQHILLVFLLSRHAGCLRGDDVPQGPEDPGVNSSDVDEYIAALMDPAPNPAPDLPSGIASKGTLFHLTRPSKSWRVLGA